MCGVPLSQPPDHMVEHSAEEVYLLESVSSSSNGSCFSAQKRKTYKSRWWKEDEGRVPMALDAVPADRDHPLPR
jgi:hypothetical protein